MEMRDHEATRLKIRQCTSYPHDFKRTVVQYADKKGNREAGQRFGICESNIRRWKRMRAEIFGSQHANSTVTNSGKGADGKRGRPIKMEPTEEMLEILDSMPLDERLHRSYKEDLEREALELQSQSLTPTKLKVSRQKAPETPPNEEVCLRWNSHHLNMQSTLPSLLLKEQYVDVTLVAERKLLKCHKIILSSCSPYFEDMLQGIDPHQHPVLFMKDIPYWVLKSLLDFMYAGEVHIYQNKLQELLATAELLQIKGLAGKKNGDDGTKQQPEVSRKYSQDKQQDKQNEKQYQQQVERKSAIQDDSTDPLNLLTPLYEEPAPTAHAHKITKYISRRGFGKKMRKRKLSVEAHDDHSSPLLLQSTRGTRSRPKLTKFYHPPYEALSKPEPENVADIIERQPHAGLPVEIKSEPMDYDDSAIEIHNVAFEEQQFNSFTISNVESIQESLTNDAKDCDDSQLDDKVEDKDDLLTEEEKLDSGQPEENEQDLQELDHSELDNLDLDKLATTQPDNDTQKEEKQQAEDVQNDDLVQPENAQIEDKLPPEKEPEINQEDHQTDTKPSQETETDQKDNDTKQSQDTPLENVSEPNVVLVPDPIPDEDNDKDNTIVEDIKEAIDEPPQDPLSNDVSDDLQDLGVNCAEDLLKMSDSEEQDLVPQKPPDDRFQEQAMLLNSAVTPSPVHNLVNH